MFCFLRLSFGTLIRPLRSRHSLLLENLALRLLSQWMMRVRISFSMNDATTNSNPRRPTMDTLLPVLGSFAGGVVADAVSAGAAAGAAEEGSAFAIRIGTSAGGACGVGIVPVTFFC